MNQSAREDSPRALCQAARDSGSRAGGIVRTEFCGLLGVDYRHRGRRTERWCRQPGQAGNLCAVHAAHVRGNANSSEVSGVTAEAGALYWGAIECGQS